jgi:hypothetical protein
MSESGSLADKSRMHLLSAGMDRGVNLVFSDMVRISNCIAESPTFCKERKRRKKGNESESENEK